ncbi:hypothetical protein BJ322DRAFT_512353 [Thelephora terrestris]|uniref:GPI anchored protein n=1 Tax=Thelephora terrestris TaxID=56493 RepID=A0A9P6H3C4_9AGAM|nr:hypothetical protein BJ322DRAFT_512353 [Thelephora terrestris]
MLLWTSLLCLFSANLVASQFAQPGVLADYDPSTVLQPMNNNLQSQDSSDDLHVIRGLLKSRQSGCPTNYGECTNPAGRCCPSSGSCCQTEGCCQAGYFCYSTGCCPNGSNGCGGNSCCDPGESCCSGGGCCQSGYTCATVNGVAGCCPVGTTCTTNGDNPQCETPGYVVCTGETFCCPPAYTCYRDSAGNPECSLGGSSFPSTLTGTNFPNTNGPSGTFIGTSSTVANGPSTLVISSATSSGSTSGPTPSSSNNSGGGLSSSAVSVAVDAILALFVGVGVFAHLL